MNLRSYISRREIILTRLHYAAICFADEWYDDYRGARDRFTAHLDQCNSQLHNLDLEVERDGDDSVKDNHRLFRTSGAG